MCDPGLSPDEDTHSVSSQHGTFSPWHSDPHGSSVLMPRFWVPVSRFCCWNSRKHYPLHLVLSRHSKTLSLVPTPVRPWVRIRSEGDRFPFPSVLLTRGDQGSLRVPSPSADPTRLLPPRPFAPSPRPNVDFLFVSFPSSTRGTRDAHLSSPWRARARRCA